MTFEEPKEVDPYMDFDWQEFLGGKYMASYERLQGSKKNSEVWLCSDGTFKSKLKRKGVFAGTASEYMGNKKGTWRAGEVGSNSTLTLEFKNLPPVTLDIYIEEEKIFVNGTRFFFMQDDICK
jgi:hypothetical protein